MISVNSELDPTEILRIDKHMTCLVFMISLADYDKQKKTLDTKSEDESGDQNVTNGISNDKKLSVQLKNNNISGLAEGMKLFDRICKDLQSKTITIFLIDYQKYQ